MPKHIQAPDGTTIEFPDTMDDTAIESAMGKLYPAKPDFAANPPAVPNPAKEVNVQPAPKDEGFISSFASAIGAPPKIGDYLEGPAHAITHPVDSAKLLANAYSDTANNEFNQMKSAAKNGDPVGAIVHGIGYGVPFVGPVLAKAMEQTNDQNYKGALGTIAGVAGPALAQAGLEHVTSPTLDAATTPKPSASDTLALRRALRPQDKDLRFDQHVQNAWPRIQEQVAQNGVPDSLPAFDEMVKNAKKQVWAESSDLLNQAASARPKVAGLLPAGSAEIATGYPQIVGESSASSVPTESRPTLQLGEPAEIQQVPRTDKGIGSLANVVPERIMGTQPAIGSLSNILPDSVLAPKTEAGIQYLTGADHPEMSGTLTNPGTFTTRDVSKIAATRDRLGAVINDPEQFDKLSPGEQTAYQAQYDRLDKLATPGPNVPTGPTISGDVIADAIQKSIRPRNNFLNSPTAQALTDRADAYRGRRIPLDQAEDFLQDANNEASGWYNQATRDPHGPQLGASAAAEAGAIRGQLYNAIDTLSQSDPGTAAKLKQQYGALDALHNYAAKRIPVAARQAPLNLAQQLSVTAAPAVADFFFRHNTPEALAAAGLGYGAATAARKINSPEFLIQRALTPDTEISPVLLRALQLGGRSAAAGNAVNAGTQNGQQ